MSYASIRATAFALVLIAVTARASAQPAPNPPAQPRDAGGEPSFGSGTIKGQVVDAATGRGLPRVSLELSGGQPSGSAGEMSDDDGRFVFRGLPPGQYSLAATKTGFETQRLPETRRGRRVRFLDLNAGGTIENANLALYRNGAITGRVLDRFGEPVQHARVSLMRFARSGGAPQQLSGATRAQTNDIGEFRLAPVPAGRFLLVAEADVQPFHSPHLPPQKGGFVAYPQAPSIDQAQPIVIERGQEVRDLELQLFPTRIARVSGVILDSTGAPAKNAHISVGFFALGEPRSYGGMTTEARDGRFEVTLAPGSYNLRASTGTRGAPTADTLSSASLRLTVTGEPIEGLTLQLGAPRTLAGRLQFVSSRLPPQTPTTARVFVDSSGGECEAGQATVNLDFTFSVQVSGDRCLVSASASGRWFVRSIMQGSDEVMFDGVRLGDRRSVDDVVVTLSDNITHAAALVADAKGQPAEEFVVVVFPAEKARRPVSRYGNWNHSVTREVGPGRGVGGAPLDGLLPGDYFIVAVNPDAYDAGDPSYDELEPYAQRITIVEGDRRVVTLKVTDVPLSR
jgi:hypothetical protein